ncbi:sugar porter family MFS transporter [Oerskovia turbata]|uniref:Sugar porter family MFS transporter n=1 Tax=Oerskovia turbata TaxID=1713 RepID=A0A4Q1KRK8_9CELL|nr:sugar porter family MFS transporter [Oerskovia turbata]RXR25321.1 sugar porter family MFS transporter [Oerskovia turbata]RXR32738.1 sugar porter family MFS transporter [Oerskovia turbata]TGJ95585.1 sugar porter family MFS transporter [Actinotalea fermentans ATCC 43279 = JCM 9966 = DSM 3133]
MSAERFRPRVPGRVFLACLAAALGGLLFGFDTSVVNSAVGALSEHFDLTASMRGMVASLSLLGCAAGAWFAGAVSERLGRVRVMLLSALLFGLCAVAAAFAPSVAVLLPVRLLAGVGIGAASVMAPAYIAEIAAPRSRGRLGGLQQLFITIGIFVALAVGLAMSRAAGGAVHDLWAGFPAWRWMFLVELVPAALYGLAALRLPESPRYLVGRGREVEARRVLQGFTGLADDEVDEEVDRIRMSIGAHATTSLRDLRGPALGLRPIVWIGLGVAALVQLSGINAVFVYSTSLWESVGFTESEALTMSLVTAGVNIAVTVVAIGLADRFGRRPVLAAGSVGMALALAVTAFAFGQATTSASGELVFPVAWAMTALVAVNLMVVSFGLTWGPLGWVLLGEMFPPAIRSTALAVATAVQWFVNYAVTRSFPVVSEAWGLPATYGTFAAISAFGVFFVLRFLPETKGRSLDEMGDGTRAA